MSIQPSDQYQIIKTALDNGKRIGYDTANRRFVSLSRKEEQHLSADSSIVASLAKIGPIVQQFIQENGITDVEAQALEKAFTQRVKSLKGRFFGRSKRKEAIGALESITRGIFQSRLDEWLQSEAMLGNKELAHIAYERMLKAFDNRFQSRGARGQFDSLDLGYCDLTTVPPGLDQLTHLHFLDLSYNRMTSLPSEISALINLQVLFLDCNRLECIPQARKLIPRAKTLHILDADKQFPHIRDLTEEERFAVALKDAKRKDDNFKYTDSRNYIPRTVARYIQDYDLTEEHRFTIALEVAKQCGFRNPTWLQKYDLTQEHHFAVVIEGAKQGEEFSKKVEMYGLTREEDRFALALEVEEALNRKGGFRALQTHLYDLTEEHRFMVVVKHLKQGGWRPNIVDQNDIQDPRYVRCIMSLCFLNYIAIHNDDYSRRIYFSPEEEYFTILHKQYPLFKGLFERVSTDRKELYKQGLIASALLDLERRDLPLLPEYIGVLQECASYPSFSLAADMMGIAYSIIPEHFASYQSLAEKVHMHLPMLFFTAWRATAGDADVKNFRLFLEQRDLRKELRDVKTGRLQQLLNTLQSIANTSLTNDEKLRLITSCARPEGVGPLSSEEFFSRLSCLGALIVFGKERELIGLTGHHMTERLTHLMTTAFQENIDVSGVADFARRYSETFGSMRTPHAILTYISRLKTLRDDHLVAPLKRFICGVLNGTFIEERYEPMTAHLERLNRKAPQVYARWKESPPPEEINIDGGATQKEFSFLSFLKQKILEDGHVPLKEIPYLRNFLQGIHPKKQMAVVEALLKKEKGDRPILHVQLLCMQLAQEPQDPAPLIQKIAPLVTGFELKNDIDGLLKKHEISGKLWVTDTDRAEDLLLCGTEVMGSCQRIDGDPYLNQGLLGYLLDGKIRVAIIKDREGKIVARSILKLLWSKRGPALFQERIYPDPVDVRLERALNQHVEKRAKELKVPLFRGAGNEKLSSLDSRAPEYEDGGVGLSPDGCYAIKVKRVFLN